MRKNIYPRALAYAICATFALATAALGQHVQVRSDSKESKEIPVTQEPEPLVNFILETGYTSEYNFRGTNLMPESDGGMFLQGQATAKVGPGTLTLGVWYIMQLGDAVANSWAISEGGSGSASASGFFSQVPGGPPVFTFYDRLPTTTQTRFSEVDLFASYKFPLGPIDVTLGNIIFLIQREARTFELDVLPPGFIWTNPPTFTRFATFGPIHTVENETFDRIYVRLSTTKLCPHITPSITYYQTIYNDGIQPTAPIVFELNQFGGVNTDVGPTNERNEELGGYLEGRLNGNFPVGHWLDINPYGLVSVSFKDRTEPSNTGAFGGRPLTGFNHAQAGLELNFHVTNHVEISPQVAYAYHISVPPVGTDRNEFWGGVKISVSLP